MPRTQEQNKQIKDKRRAKLLSASLRVFASRGYRDTSVDDITKEAECSHGLFYHYFDSKKDVFASLLDELVLPSRGVSLLNDSLKIGGYLGLERIASLFDGSREDSYALILLIRLGEEGIEVPGVPSPKEVISKLVKAGQKEGKVIDGNPEEITDALICVLQRNLEGSLVRKNHQKRISKEVFLNLLSK